MGDVTGKGHHTNPLTPKSHRFTRTAGMGLCHSTRDRARRRRGRNDYSSLAYTAYRNTQELQGDPQPRTLHAAHVTVLTSGIRCLNKQLPKTKWGKSLHWTVIWSVWHHTDFWQRRQNRLFFLFLFLFLVFLFFSLNVRFSVAVNLSRAYEPIL